MSVDEIAKFRRDRLDEREARALAADVKQGDPSWQAWPVVGSVPREFRVRSVESHRPIANTGDVAGDDKTDTSGILDGAAIAAHIADNDPARVLRQVTADRKLVDEVTGWQHERLHDGDEANTGQYSCSPDGSTCDCGLQARQEAVLRLLALPDAAHPDYRSQWAPV